jgi:hypothetical protein
MAEERSDPALQLKHGRDVRRILRPSVVAKAPASWPTGQLLDPPSPGLAEQPSGGQRDLSGETAIEVGACT